MPTQLLDDLISIPEDAQLVDPSTGRVLGAWVHVFDQLAALSKKLVGTEILTSDDLGGDDAIQIGTDNLKDDFGTIILQRAWIESTASGSTTASMPIVSVPVATDGLEVLTTSFAPKRDDSRVRIHFEVLYTTQTSPTGYASVTLSGNASAIAYTTRDGDNTNIGVLSVDCDIPSWGVTALSVGARVGSGSAGTLYYNKAIASTLFAGTSKMILSVEEYKATPIPAA